MAHTHTHTYTYGSPLSKIVLVTFVSPILLAFRPVLALANSAHSSLLLALIVLVLLLVVVVVVVIVIVSRPHRVVVQFSA